MKTNEIFSKNKTAKKRVGRGTGNGLGRTCGRGDNGQKSRSGSRKLRAGFEGGQTPLYRRMPKMGGFNNINRVSYNVVNLKDLENNFNDGDTINAETLHAKNLVPKKNSRVKILGVGTCTKKLTIDVATLSTSAAKALGVTLEVKEKVISKKAARLAAEEDAK